MSSPLRPPERMALTVARAQIKRGEDPTPNVAAVLIMALARLIDKIGDEETQLQALAAVWRSNDIRAVKAQSNVRGCWPGLAALLDAPIEEDNDE